VAPLGTLLFGLRVVAPLLIAYVLLQRGLQRGTVAPEYYARRMEWLRMVALVGAFAFAGLGLFFVVAEIAAQ
jgi:hypothetical protein